MDLAIALSADATGGTHRVDILYTSRLIPSVSVNVQQYLFHFLTVFRAFEFSAVEKKGA
ncbi:hypothetical protein [Geomesophilobacter sediminis]|uniref:Uncharacterized protein n=1 Tax=Geomesophilobacter sediminis TaxID=2798584 RepID=A0A8J7M296_9BACT|nr:hypothetical protein [Geomesophilobacter sediminis]MBJ6727403.1 hypothetical protein [Geomesophilobacter sediminis]